MDVDNELDGKFMQQFSSMGTTDKDVLITEFQKLLGSELNPACCAFFLDMNNWNLQAAIGSYYDYEQPSNLRLPSMSLVNDITIGEGESVPPNTAFIKTWRIQNTGQDAYPPGSCLRFISGEQFGHRERVQVECLEPGTVADVSVDMISPATVGIYQGQWRMQTPTGLYFGDPYIKVFITLPLPVVSIWQGPTLMGCPTFRDKWFECQDKWILQFNCPKHKLILLESPNLKQRFYHIDMIWIILQVEEHGLLGVTQQLSKFGGDFTAPMPSAGNDNPFASPNKLNQSPASSTMSTAAQSGSLPGSPFTPAGSACTNNQQQFNQQTSNCLVVSTCNTGVRTALFQGMTDTTPNPPNTSPNLSPNPHIPMSSTDIDFLQDEDTMS